VAPTQGQPLKTAYSCLVRGLTGWVADGGELSSVGPHGCGREEALSDVGLVGRLG
jgi:hypothetical protein